MMLSETAFADDQATGLQNVALDEIEAVVDAFNRHHLRHHVDYQLLPDGDFDLILFDEAGEPVLSTGTLDIDDFWRVAEE